MTLGNSAFDLADMRAEQEREAAIARASAQLTAQGEPYCIQCDSEISAARRWAYPAAFRCTECQSAYERKQG